MSEPTATASNSMEVEEEVYVPSGNIKSVKRIVGTWNFVNGANTCAICRNDLTSPSVNYISSPKESVSRKDSCKIAFLSCNHFYHYDCITQWFKTRLNNCPLCSRDSTIVKIEPVKFYETEI